MTEEQYKKLINDVMDAQYCNGIQCENCVMHTELTPFISKYHCTCILIAMTNVIIESSGVEYSD